jgi:putative hemolysin
MDNSHTLYFVLIFVCLLLSAFFSSAEVAIISMSRIRVKHLLSNDVKFADLLDSFQKQPGMFLSAILLGNNLVVVAATSLATIIAISIWGDNLGALLATIIMTVLILILCEVIPKTLAAHNAEKMALAYTIPIQLLIWILYPLVWVLNKIGAGFTRMVTDVGEAKLTVDEAEIRTAIDVGEAEGVWKDTEADMIHKAFEFPDRPVKDVMQPRTEVTFIEEGTSLEEFLKIYSEHPHSRFPVFKETQDNVTGLLTVKDVMMAIARNSTGSEDHIDTLVRPAYFVPETKRLGEILAEMRDHNIHTAVVIDEFGGVAGVANLEHLAAEIMGSIGDEMIADEKEITPIDANTYEMDGGLRVEEANDQLDLDLPCGEYDTVAGFILSHLGRIPRQGEHFKFRDLKIAITEIANRKIERITITREKNAPPAS